ncbi:WD repeat-containing protein 24 [Perkinsus chesapeaki]|uniref:WD repeat-containing protein 24 n=1 Tax=Perkinsus chesapeaki TaxID=330153 RepID=A0A7J6N0T4_PERCH|nr:WD repeat-containing protein 24 [Perkinsus chesapeaki]
MSGPHRTPPVWKEKFEMGITTLAPSPHSTAVVVGGRAMLKVADMETRGLKTVRNLKNKFNVTAAAIHPLVDHIACTGSSNGQVFVWDYRNMSYSPVIERWMAHPRAVTAMCFMPQRRDSEPCPSYLLSAGQEGNLTVSSLPTYQGKRSNVGEVGDHEWRMHITHGQLRGDSRGSVRLMNLPAVRDIDAVPAFSGICQVLCANDDGSVEIYHTSTPEAGVQPLQPKPRKITASLDSVCSARYSSVDDNVFAAAGRDRYIRIYDTRTPCEAPGMKLRSPSSLWAVRWRPGSGVHLASCHSVMDNTVNVWDLRMPHMPGYVFNSHADSIVDMFWADNHHIVSGSKDCTVRMHALRDATIPIENLRTVNISFSFCKAQMPPASPTEKGTTPELVNTVADVCDTVDRTTFVTIHDDLDMQKVAQNGFPVSTSRKATNPTEQGPSEVALHKCIDAETPSSRAPQRSAATTTTPAGLAPPTDRTKLVSPRGLPSRTDRIRCFNRFAYEGGMDAAVSRPRSPRSRTPPQIRGRPPLPPTATRPGGNDDTAVSGKAEDGYGIGSGGGLPSTTNQGSSRTCIVQRIETQRGSSEDLQALVDLCPPLARLVRNISSRPAGVPCQQIVLNSLEKFRDDPICTSRFTNGKLDFLRVTCWIFQQCPPSVIEEARQQVGGCCSPSCSSDSTKSSGCTEPTAFGLAPNNAPHPQLMWLSRVLQSATTLYQTMGDVVMCIVVLLVKLNCGIFNTPQDEESCVNYITLLRRLRLWDLATSFTNACAAYEDVAGVSHAGTGVKTRCTSCGKECDVGTEEPICSHCHKNNRSCVVCGGNVKGLWLACQVCGHGGHVTHMSDWFATQGHETCPSPNCGHVCLLSPVSHRDSVHLMKC